MEEIARDSGGTIDALTREARRLSAAIEVVLEALERPALLLSCEEKVLGANAAARLTLKSGAGAFELAKPRWILAALRAGGRSAGFLAILSDDRASEPAVFRELCGPVRSWRLTDRQAAVLALVVRGLTNEIIADTLGIGERTVEFHVSRILDKAGAHNRATLIASAIGPRP